MIKKIFFSLIKKKNLNNSRLINLTLIINFKYYAQKDVLKSNK